MNKQHQRAGDNSQLLQVEGDFNNTHIHEGATLDDIKQVALLVFEANFHKLAEEAQAIALQRVETITERIIHRLWKEHPTGIKSVNDPDFQYALYSAQKEYARNGDDSTGNILVDLIAERCNCTDRNIRKIICDDSLNVIPRLNGEMISVLGVVFFFTRYYGESKISNTSSTLNARYPDISKTSLSQYFNKYFSPFNSLLYTSYHLYKHLESISCWTLTNNNTESLLDIISKKYSGYFQTGFTQTQLSKTGINGSDQEKLIFKSPNNPSKLQFNTLNHIQLSLQYQILNLDNNIRKNLNKLFNTHMLDKNEIAHEIVSTCPGMGELFGVWDRNNLGKIELTGSGIAIGHAALKNHAPDIPDLSYWIN